MRCSAAAGRFAIGQNRPCRTGGEGSARIGPSGAVPSITKWTRLPAVGQARRTTKQTEKIRSTNRLPHLLVDWISIGQSKLDALRRSVAPWSTGTAARPAHVH
jgi:hypothetical protein